MGPNPIDFNVDAVDAGAPTIRAAAHAGQTLRSAKWHAGHFYFSAVGRRLNVPFLNPFSMSPFVAETAMSKMSFFKTKSFF